MITNQMVWWYHRVYEKEGEKIDKYQDLKREI